MASKVASPTPTTPASFSRYRSVRQTLPAVSQHEHHDLSSPPPPNPEAIARSKSRYRRTRPAATAAQYNRPPLPAATSQTSPTVEDPFKTPPTSRNTSSSNRSGLQGEHAPTYGSPPMTWSPKRAERETRPIDRIAVSDEADHRDEQSTGHSAGRVRGRSSSHDERQDQDANVRGYRHLDHNSETAATKVKESIVPGGGGIVPGIDAPVSAVNAGERRVKVEFKTTCINLAVMPDTTARNLIESACDRLDQTENLESYILLESFRQLGLERALRRYEHVRDVMNSWGRDSQNALVLKESASGGQDPQLEAGTVPAEQPGETAVYIYYSYKPGKWDKRWITLRSDGQMVASKKQGANEKDHTNICHISDFDVYTPTRRQLSKHLKPPKKHCFAIKSQQKSSMFESTANFVHFVATDDRILATEWYKAVQGWRSWYLVHMKGEGQGAAHQSMPSTSTTVGHRRMPSRDQIRRGSAEAAQGHVQQASSNAAAAAAEADDRPIRARNRLTREKRAPPVSFPTRLLRGRSGSVEKSDGAGSRLIQGASPQTMEDATFAPTGLLGRSYSQRRDMQRQQEAGGHSAASSAAGPRSVNDEMARPSTGEQGRGLSRTSSVRSNKNTAGAQRNSSVQVQKPKPLLDFSNPEYREPPQHLRKGRGVVLEQRPVGGLVEAATTPEVAISIPPATRTKRQNSVDIGSPPSSSGPPQNPFLSDSDPASGGEGTFTGLLARRSAGWGGASVGRGVMTGNRNAKGPMLDVAERSQFAPGSLLSQVEHEIPKEGPIIERGERREGKITTGEGF
ncbi:MAG: hypothetical protein M1825_005891 [Sarcosagium campestre]|nr:MAG: hypothetical protein M1825_005891 [Sarcosagium campestre]